MSMNKANISVYHHYHQQQQWNVYLGGDVGGLDYTKCARYVRKMDEHRNKCD